MSRDGGNVLKGARVAAGDAGVSAAGPQVVSEASLIAEISRAAGAECPDCRAALCGHAILISIAAGLKNEPRCAGCLAVVLGHEPEGFRRHVVSYIHHRDCYLAAWQWVSAGEADCPTAAGASVWDLSRAAIAADSAYDVGADAVTGGDAAPGAPAVLVEVPYDGEWDAGEMGCGELVLELRKRLQAMAPGRVLKVVARDPGAPQDLPAWCAMTGHRLVFSRHPEYEIEKRRDR